MAQRRAQAMSAGTNQASAVDPTVVEFMKEVGINISDNHPKN
ncbi:hypothetical protein ACFLXL_01450 [Chloroflexota bacterium]